MYFSLQSKFSVINSNHNFLRVIFLNTDMTQKLEQHTSRKHNLFTFKPQVFFVIQRARGKEGSVHFLVLFDRFAFGEGDWFCWVICFVVVFLLVLKSYNNK